MFPEDYQDMCAKCRHRNKCKEPCAFVEAILTEDNRPPFYERNTTGQDDTPIRIIKSKNHRHEINQTNLDQYAGPAPADDDEPRRQTEPFSTEAENPFVSYQPKLSQTTVFINRFFLGRPYEDIASDLEVSVDTVVSMFKRAKERLFEALYFADNRQATIKRFESIRRRNGAKFGKLTKGQRWFLMHDIFDLSVKEIADMEGATVHRVNHAIIDATDRIKAGLATFLEPTPDEVKQAQERIEAKRQRDRKQWAARQSK